MARMTATQVEDLKLVVIDSRFSDEEVEAFFMNTEVANEDELREAVALLEEHRPALARKLSARCARRK